MTPADLILAAVLLTSPPGTIDAVPTVDRWPVIRDAVHKVAVDWEIMDLRETKYIFAKLEEFETDLALLRKRVLDFADAPRAAEALRFPDRRMSAEMIQFNRAFRQRLAERTLAEPDRADEFREAGIETDRLYHVWDAARDARSDFYYVTVRRQALKKLKASIGEEAYSMGQMPPNVPLWRFTEWK